uniref:DUF4005 domain-containing protein n=1 Tax=Aegilops tauschii TaxID=37682 RepID=R7W737_AEGTA
MWHLSNIDGGTIQWEVNKENIELEKQDAAIKWELEKVKTFGEIELEKERLQLARDVEDGKIMLAYETLLEEHAKKWQRIMQPACRWIRKPGFRRSGTHSARSRRPTIGKVAQCLAEADQSELCPAGADGQGGQVAPKLLAGQEGPGQGRRGPQDRPRGDAAVGAGVDSADGDAGVDPGGQGERRWSIAVAIATAAAAEAAVAAKQAAAAVVRYAASAPGSKRAVIGIEEAAAIKIQSVFRSYLARKALCALRGLVKLQALVRGHLVRRQASNTLRCMQGLGAAPKQARPARPCARSGGLVKLQALVRGHLVRRQASNTLRCMQALVAAQNRARTARLRLLDDVERPLRTPRMTPTRRSPHHPRLRQHQEMEENIKIVEVDTGAGDVRCTPRTSRRSSCYATPLCRTPSKVELYQKVSPTPSALTDASGRSYSGRLDMSSASVHDSECGSTSTMRTAATSMYCWSAAANSTGVA